MTENFYNKISTDVCYSDDWRHLSFEARSSTNFVCTLCDEPADLTHHAFYTVGGTYDELGFNLFPLCVRHHKLIHFNKVQWDRVKHQQSPRSHLWLVSCLHAKLNNYEGNIYPSDDSFYDDVTFPFIFLDDFSRHSKRLRID